jgi:hypothetical protein
MRSPEIRRGRELMGSRATGDFQVKQLYITRRVVQTKRVEFLQHARF